MTPPASQARSPPWVDIDILTVAWCDVVASIQHEAARHRAESPQPQPTGSRGRSAKAQAQPDALPCFNLSAK